MNIKINAAVLFVLSFFSLIWYSCNDKVELPSQPLDSYNKIYMPQAVNGPVDVTLEITDSTQTMIYGANYGGGLGYPSNDIPVDFMVDKSKVDSFNMANHTSYELLPDSTYTLSVINSVIPKGELSTPPLSVLFKTKGAGAMPVLKTFLLPISIVGATVNINVSLQTTFYLVSSQPDLEDYPAFDRSSWSIVNFSSQEANGEGPDNGRAVFALDGDNSTFWHTQWQGASPGPPHYLTIDMGSVKTIHGLSFLGRQSDGAGKPNEVHIQLSIDNITWTDAGTFNLQNNQNLQSVFLPKGFGQSARYFKVIINSAYGGSYTQIAELNAF